MVKAFTFFLSNIPIIPTYNMPMNCLCSIVCLGTMFVYNVIRSLNSQYKQLMNGKFMYASEIHSHSSDPIIFLEYGEENLFLVQL